MARRQKIIRDVKIEKIAAGGNGFSRVDGKVLFIENAVPGDIVDVRITKHKKDYAQGRILEIKEPSEDRGEAFCDHFGVCGGCKWQFLDYEKQLAYKQDIVLQSFSRIGKLEHPEPDPILGAKKTRHYRNKLEFTFSNKRWLRKEEIDSEKKLERNGLGFHVKGYFEKVEHVNRCYLMEDLADQIRNSIYKYALEHELSFYDILKQEGLLRNLIIRSSRDGQWMCNVIFAANEEQNIKGLLKFIESSFPQLTSIHYVINEKKNDSIFDLEVQHYSGKGYITEKLAGIEYKISPKSFFQTNPEQAENLYLALREILELKATDIVYDLYTGTGSIALFLSAQCKEIIGVEEVSEAIIDAQFNASLNSISNARFYTGDVKDFLVRGDEISPNVIVVDPPRAGLAPKVVEEIVNLNAEKVLYVSCNPATQARDISLMDEKYKITKMRAVDMFPQTAHIENIALLERR